MPQASPRFNWIMGVLSMLLAVGVVQDIWAHNHGRVDQSFFTPWHAVLYGTMVVVGLFLGVTAVRNVRQGHGLTQSLPPGYLLSLAGVFLFGLGGALDLWWHTIFGIEEDTEALLSPTHLLLLTSALLIVTGPMRSAWLTQSPGTAHGWRTLGAMLLGATAVLTLLGQFIQFASPMVTTFAAKDPTRLPAFTDIFVMDADGRNQTRITVEPDKLHYGAAWSPDGNQLVFMIRSGASQRGELYISRANGTHMRMLTNNGRKNFNPAWSPSGNLIAFNSQVGINTQTSEIYRVTPDGKGESALTVGNTESYNPSWSPNGQRLVFASKRSGSWKLYVMNVDGSNQHVLATAGQASSPAWSPDGSHIAYTADPQGTSRIAIIPAGGGAARVIGPPQSDSATWSPDGRFVAFSAPAGPGDDIFRAAISGGKPVDLTLDRAIVAVSPAWSPDGRHIAYSGLGHNGRISDDGNHAFGVADVIIQSLWLVAMLLLLVRTWSLPLGSMTLLIAVPSIAQLIMFDNYWLTIGVLVTGLIADALIVWLRTPVAGGLPLYLIGGGIPAVYQIANLCVLAVTTGLAWSVNMIAGSVLYAGATGLFLAFVLDWPSHRRALT